MVDEKPPQAGLSVVKRTLVLTAADKLPIVSVIVKIFREANAAHQDERLAIWAEHLIGDEEGDAFAAGLEAALKGSERATVRKAVLDGARSATEAVDDIAVPAIALLTRLFLRTGSPPLRVYRRLLAMLESIDAEVFKAIATVIPKLVGAQRGETLATNFMFDPAPEINDWNWFTTVPNPEGTGMIPVPLLRGEIARRVVESFVGDDRGLFERTAWPTKPGEPRRVALSTEVPRPTFEILMLEILSLIWFVPEPSS